MRLRDVLQASSVLLFVGACASTYIWLIRRGLLYDAEGRYFDEAQGVVIHEQTLTVAGTAAGSLAVCAILCWVIARRI